VFLKEAEAYVVSVGDGCFGVIPGFDAFADLGLGQLEGFVGSAFVDRFGGEERVHFFGDGV